MIPADKYAEIKWKGSEHFGAGLRVSGKSELLTVQLVQQTREHLAMQSLSWLATTSSDMKNKVRVYCSRRSYVSVVMMLSEKRED